MKRDLTDLAEGLIEMADNPGYVEKYVVLACRYYFGAHTFISGVNHYVEIFPDRLAITMAAGHSMTNRFLSVLVDSGLYDFCKIIEIIVGAALLLGFFVPLALILEVPVTMIIFYMSIFMSGTPRTIFTGTREVLLNFGLLTVYWGYFRPIFLRPMLPIQPIWRDGIFTGKIEGTR